jgi:signal transduction histidine kinase
MGLVSLSSVVADVLATLDWAISERGAQVLVDELPMVKGQVSQLGQLFQNLLTNALKFSRPSGPPRVEVRSALVPRSELPPTVRPTSQAPYFHQISVRDEGIGFDPQYVDRIFQVFQRLHGKQAYAGTGIGLAICQQVVNNHGGGITATSKLGEGATFWVYLPAELAV